MTDSQNIGMQANQPTATAPNTLHMKQLTKIQNNRYLNQNIYHLFVLGRHNQCLNLISQCKNDEFKLYIKALILKHRFEIEKSLILFTECEVMNKTNFGYLKGIAKNYYLLGKYKSSLEAAKEAFKINSSDYQIFYIMAKINIALKDPEGAIQNLNKALSKEPNQQSYILLSRLLIDKGSLDDAAAISPQSDEIYEMLGEIYGNMGLQQDSLRYYEESVQRNSSRYSSVFAVGAIKLAQGEIEEALRKYTLASKLSINSAAFWNNLAGIMLKKNKTIVSYCCLKKALFLDPFRWDIHCNLGLLLMKQKKYVGAQLHFRSALKHKKDPQIYNMLAISLAQLGDYQNAQNCYTEIMKMTKNDKYFINFMCMLMRKGDIGKCKEIYERVNIDGISEQMKDKVKEMCKKF